jgi:hypothetical protein
MPSEDRLDNADEASWAPQAPSMARSGAVRPPLGLGGGPRRGTSLLMGPALTVLLAAALGAAPLTVSTTVIEGEASDALVGEGGGLLLTVAGPRRGLVRLTAKGAGPLTPAPKGAISVAGCGERGERLVFATADGLVDAKGTLLLGGQALFVLPDREHFYVAQLCGEVPGTRDELRLVVREGLKVLRPGRGAARILAWTHTGRTYSGRVHRGLRPARPYGGASSVYAPHLVEGDVDQGGTPDLVAQHEGRLAVYLRGADGQLRTTPAAEVDLYAASGGAGGDLRVHFGDLDDDGRLDAVIGRAEGPLSERSTAWWLRSTKAGLLAGSTRLWDDEGLAAPLAVIDRPRAARDPHSGSAVLATALDTNLVAMGGVLLSGNLSVPLKLRRVTGPEQKLISARGPEVGIELQVRRMKTSGALPLASVDLDGDGLTDLLDLGAPGEARVYRGTRQGFASTPEVFDVPSFIHVVPLPAAGTVVLLGPPAKGKTRVTWIRSVGRG